MTHMNYATNVRDVLFKKKQVTRIFTPAYSAPISFVEKLGLDRQRRFTSYTIRRLLHLGHLIILCMPTELTSL